MNRHSGFWGNLRLHQKHFPQALTKYPQTAQPRKPYEYKELISLTHLHLTTTTTTYLTHTKEITA